MFSGSKFDKLLRAYQYQFLDAVPLRESLRNYPVLEFLNNLWGLGTK
jgi:hypothetical protein